MNRRGFLGAIAAAVAGASLDPERALWVPGRKLVSIPAPRVMLGPDVLNYYLPEQVKALIPIFERRIEELERMIAEPYVPRVKTGSIVTWSPPRRASFLSS